MNREPPTVERGQGAQVGLDLEGGKICSMKLVGFAFFKPNSFFGWMIVLGHFLKGKGLGPYSHVEIYAPERTIVDQTGVKRYSCFSSYEGDGGVRAKLIALDKAGATRVEFEVDDTKLIAAWGWALTQLDLAYGWREIRGFMLPWRVGKPETWICSEICAEFAKRVGLVPLATRCERVSPSGLWEMLNPPWDGK